jgi:hypothetical protein
MNAIIYVYPQKAEAMNKWLNNFDQPLPPSFWFEPIKDFKKRQTLIQLIISLDDLQKLLDVTTGEEIKEL